MNPYLMEKLVKERVEQLHREAAGYRLRREAVRRRTRRVSTSIPVRPEEPTPHPTGEQPCTVW
jgi:hypothetical protein